MAPSVPGAGCRQPDWFSSLKKENACFATNFASLPCRLRCSWPASAIAAAGALLQYARSTQAGDLPHIQGLTVEHESSYLGLDAATRRNLELTETLRGQLARPFFR